jgi:hypothetical protein
MPCRPSTATTVTGQHERGSAPRFQSRKTRSSSPTAGVRSSSGAGSPTAAELGDVLDAVGTLGEVLVEARALASRKRVLEVGGHELDELVAGEVEVLAHDHSGSSAK